MWVDIHTHLNMLEIPPEEAIQNAKDRGVEKFITIGTCPDDHPTVLELAQKFAPEVYCSLGVHPHDAKLFDENCRKFMEEHLDDLEVAALGEIGLDYYYDNSPRDVQQRAFEEQLQMALDRGLPVEIHTRDAEEDTINILKNFGGKISGVLHCFTGTQKLADAALDLNLNISISGVVTFNKANELREVIKSLPLDRIHVETDAPFLAPVPHRGKKNQPAFVVDTAHFVAELLGLSVDELQKQVLLNTKNLFKKINWN